MGADQALTPGEVIEILPNAGYRVRLEDRREVLAHFASGVRRNFMRLRVGDKVQVELTVRDNSRARIVRLVERIR
jgi:translation initiation factor IF-1